MAADSGSNVPSGSVPLGTLELAVLKHLWSNGEATARGAHEALSAERDISHNTVQSTLERLYRKGLAQRRKVSHAYWYTARLDRTGLISRLIGDLAERLAGDEPTAALAAFVDVAARLDSDDLDRLEALIRQHRRTAGAEDD